MRIATIIHVSNALGTVNPVAEMIALAAKKLPGVRIAVFTNGDWIGTPGWRARPRLSGR